MSSLSKELLRGCNSFNERMRIARMRKSEDALGKLNGPILKFADTKDTILNSHFFERKIHDKVHFS